MSFLELNKPLDTVDDVIDCIERVGNEIRLYLELKSDHIRSITKAKLGKKIERLDDMIQAAFRRMRDYFPKDKRLDHDDNMKAYYKHKYRYESKHGFDDESDSDSDGSS